MRENEFHLLKRTRSPSCPLVSTTSKPAPARRAGRRAARRARQRADRGDRARASRRARTAAAAATASAAADSTTPGAPSRFEQRNQDQAAGGGADQIGGVDGVDARRQPRDRQRDDEAAGEERQRGERVDRRASARGCAASSSGRRGGARGRTARRSCDARRRATARASSASVGCRSSRRRSDVGEHAARAQAEQRDRDRQKREVVVHDDREDARQRELGHQQRGGDERDAGEVARGTRGCPDSRAQSVPFERARCIAAARVVLRRAFVGASIAWALLLPLAPFAAARPHPTPSVVALLVAGVYAIGSVDLPSAAGAFVSSVGAQMPVCARCTGIYVGAAHRGDRAARRRVRSTPARADALAPLEADARGAAAGLRLLARRAADAGDAGRTNGRPATCRRTGSARATGVPLGAAVAWLVIVDCAPDARIIR